MRLTVGVLLSCAAFGIVGASPLHSLDARQDLHDVNRIADPLNAPETQESLEAQELQEAREASPQVTQAVPTLPFVPGSVGPLDKPGGPLAGLTPIHMPTPASFFASQSIKNPPSSTHNPPPQQHTTQHSSQHKPTAKPSPAPQHPNQPPKPPNPPQNGQRPNPPPGLPNFPNFPNLPNPFEGFPNLPKVPPGFGIGPGHPQPQSAPQDHIKCTNQEVNCEFLKKQSFDLQNDDDECLRIATSFDQEGKIDIKPLAQGSDTVVYGITTDGLTASAWCNDIGWTLRRIYSKCRRGKQCFGGQGYAARNSVFMVSVGPKTGGPKIVNRYPNIEFWDTSLFRWNGTWTS
ncbi:hypothetical protein BT63DRAFT_264598 [Microthyrium microscopicum]|uniref:Uncharacterized protein n=1 Tax=Microthyrium microscopicum TaxID=703497 RepID=A0A6A6UDQ2_9PEZI|nr:hypothetical protein BT63DRAFT_264598 [Microthyrium microscopicum]